MPDNKQLPVTVTYDVPSAVQAPIVVAQFATVKDAEDWITRHAEADPYGVERGYYGIDAPEDMVNPPKGDKIAGFLEGGLNDAGEIVVNHPDLQPDENGVGHIVFSPNQARNLAQLLSKHANLVDRKVKHKAMTITESKIFGRILREIKRKGTYGEAINPLIDALLAWTEGKKDIRQIEKDLL